MSNELVKLMEVGQSLAYRLRLTDLDKRKRDLRKYGVVGDDGFLTIEGAQVFLDTLWQENPELQDKIADKLAEINKEDKANKKTSKVD